MRTWEDAESLIRKECEGFAARLSEAAGGNPTEATFRDRLMPIIADFCGKAGVRFAPKGGYSLISGGRPDTVFNRLVIEYKAPGKLGDLNTHPNNQDAIAQLQGYFNDIVKAEKQLTDRLAGVVLDGNRLIFIRKFDTGWYVDSPAATSAESCARFLRYLIYLGYGRALTADNLVEDFGIDQAVAGSMIAALENTLVDVSNPLVQKLFEQWQTFFSEVVEYKEAFTETKLRDLQRFAGRAGIALGKDEQTAKRFFFAIHSYFAILVKLLAWLAVRRQLGPRLGTPSFGQLASYPSGELQRELTQVEEGRLFRDWAKIANLLEGDFFRWYLLAWNEDIETALREVLARLDTYDPTTLEVDPESTRDLLKKLYHYLLPREIRHNLGEYYTPDWLAQMVLNQVDYAFFEDDPDKSTYVRNSLLRLRFLDPACGSGTFLVLIIKRIREAARTLCIPERQVLEAIVRNVVGFDLNPLAVIAARTNYLLALGNLIEQPHDQIDIPVYLADSVMTPYRGGDMFTKGTYYTRTAVGTFEVPQEVVSADRIDRYCSLLEDGIRDDVDADVFVMRTKESLSLSEGEFEAALPALLATYEKVRGLHREGLDGIWVRIIRNAFAPVFVQEFDYVVGNPPWVNWENLPDGYRRESRRLWQQEGLFPHGGMDTILGKGKKDISMLMAYIAMGSYLKDGGKLGFIITQSVFKTTGAGQGFRRFMLGDSTPVRVVHVDDMVELQPFEGASNRTSVVVLQKGMPTTYPVRYTYWQKTAKGRISFDSKLSEVMSLVRRRNFNAEPVNDKDKTSAWLTGRPKALKAIKKVLGKSDYKAHAGVYSGGANAVYWLEILDRQADDLVLVTNITEGQKRDVPKVPSMALEPDLIYPLLRGRDVRRWKAEPSAYILMVQDPSKRQGMDEKEMQLHYPKTWSYLKQFEAVLRRRRSRGVTDMIEGGAPFYTMFAVGDYTFARYKVVWPWISVGVRAAVTSLWDNKPVLPEHNTSFVDCKQEAEAYFICSLLNSSIGDYSIRAYYSGGGGGIASPQVLQSIRIPKFNPQNTLHIRLAELSKKAHGLAATGDEEGLSTVEDGVDCLAAELWGITEVELTEIRKSLAEIS